MWIPHVDELGEARGLKVRIDDHDVTLRYSEVIDLWERNGEFRSFFLALLSAVPFAAFRWETPPVTEASADRPFEFVVLDSPQLATRSDPRAFAAQLANVAAEGEVAVFSNLGNDATLIVPLAAGPTEAYGHLAAFARGAPPRQQHAFWQRVGQTMNEQLFDAPIWLNTAGAGVPWLHVRLDSKPKYYGHAPYCELP